MYVTVNYDTVLIPVQFSFRILHFPRFCGKQKNNQQSESCLEDTIFSIEKYRQYHNPFQADSLLQASHNGFVVHLWASHDISIGARLDMSAPITPVWSVDTRFVKSLLAVFLSLPVRYELLLVTSFIGHHFAAQAAVINILNPCILWTSHFLCYSTYFLKV